MIDTCFPVDLEPLRRALISGPVTITPNWCARRVVANAAQRRARQRAEHIGGLVVPVRIRTTKSLESTRYLRFLREYAIKYLLFPA
jgi:hypothetical protein